MTVETLDQRTRRLTPALRRLARRGARRNLSRLLGKVRPEDVALSLSDLTPDEQLAVLGVILEDYPEQIGEVFTEMSPDVLVNVFERMSPLRTAKVLESMSVDDRVAVVDWLPEALREEVLQIADVQGSLEEIAQFAYRDDSAGRIMTTEFFALLGGTTVQEAIAAIQGIGDEIEMFFYPYVVDEEGRLIGVTSLRRLLLSQPHRTLEEIMQPSVISVSTDTDQEEVARLAARYDLLAVPVIDDESRLVGIVTIDDVIDVVNEEVEEDLFKMVGSSDDELIYQARPWKVARIRLPWILINLVGLTVTGFVYEAFQLSLTEALFLMAFVPVIMGMGGNVGSQTATIAVRGLATGRIVRERTGQFLSQQIKVGILLGLVCAVLIAIGAFLKEQSVAFGVVVAVSLFLAILVASINGSVVPLLFERIGVDPAVAAGPLVTTSCDIAGILIYFGIASLMIEWLVR